MGFAHLYLYIFNQNWNPVSIQQWFWVCNPVLVSDIIPLLNRHRFQVCNSVLGCRHHTATLERCRSDHQCRITLLGWSLLHDNTPSHTSLIVCQFFTWNQVCVESSAVFPNLKLKGCFFNEISTIITATTRTLEGISQNELEQAFESLLNRCNKCIKTGEGYFELKRYKNIQISCFNDVFDGKSRNLFVIFTRRFVRE